MSNLCSIQHNSFDKLHNLTGNYNQAALLDKLIFWWQISNYTLDDDQIWFTRSIDQIANDSKLSRRSVERYLHEFEVKGLILKVNRLFMKKHLYIRISDKLLGILGAKPNQTKNTTIGIDPYITSNDSLPIEDVADCLASTISLEQEKFVTSVQINSEPTTAQIETNAHCLIINQDGVIDSANSAVSIYKGKDSNTNNNSTVKQAGNVNNLKTNPANQPKPVIKMDYAIEQAIGERISPRLKNYIKGTISNLQTQHGLHFSNPEQLFAEVVFSVLNKDDQLAGIEKDHHRVNIIAKLLREKRWLTPKGFYNHWDVGAQFKQSHADNDARYQHQKQQDMDRAGRSLFAAINLDSTPAMYMQEKADCLPYGHKKREVEQQNTWREIMINITTEERYLNQMQKQNTQKPSELTQSVIDATISKLEKLYKTKQLLEETTGIKNAA